MSVVTCPQLNVTNGNVSTTSRDYLDIVQLDCHHGYRIKGNQSLTNVSSVCATSGDWSVDDLDCERKCSHAVVFLALSVSNVVNYQRPFLQMNCVRRLTILRVFLDCASSWAGASTPYKRWSKCTMEKVGGNVFAET